MDHAPKYFNREELEELLELEYKILSKVYYHVWCNYAKPDDPFESVDWIELIFEDGSRSVLSAGDDSDGIYFFNGDIEEAKRTRIAPGLENVIRYRIVPAGDLDPWVNTLAKPIVNIEVTGPEPDVFQKNNIVFDFNDIKIGVFVAEEGLAVELVEDDEVIGSRDISED